MQLLEKVWVLGVALTTSLTFILVEAACPTGFESHASSCYILLRVSATWAEAQHYCSAVGGELAQITDNDEQTFIESYLGHMHATIGTAEIWAGGSDLVFEGKWLWANTLEPFDYTKWSPNEPNNDRGQHCLALFRDKQFLWDDFYCEQILNPLCERENLQ